MSETVSIIVPCRKRIALPERFSFQPRCTGDPLPESLSKFWSRTGIATMARGNSWKNTRSGFPTSGSWIMSRGSSPQD